MEAVPPHTGAELNSDTAYDADELGRYRSVSTLAVVALALGLLSPVSLISPLLAVVPLLAVATAWLALSRIDSSAGGLTGAGLARWGLALAVLFVVSSTVRAQVRSQLYRRQADAVAQRWLSYASSSNTGTALSMLTPSAQRALVPQPPDARGASHFDPVIAAAALRNDEHIQGLEQCSSRSGGNPSFSLVDVESETSTREPAVVCSYAVSDGSDETAQLKVSLLRMAIGGNRPRWLVQSWSLNPAPAQ